MVVCPVPDRTPERERKEEEEMMYKQRGETIEEEKKIDKDLMEELPVEQKQLLVD